MVRDLDLKPIHPGEILREELLKTHKLTVSQLAESIKLDQKVIKEVVQEKQDITAEISYRLGLYWGIREDYWLDLQKHYELDCWKEKQELKEIVKQVQPYANIS
jgi:antitoxin HigA-1